jgi:N-methylhydantoinase B/oxoprolinase/acetone carboxylase alpha subunit
MMRPTDQVVFETPGGGGFGALAAKRPAASTRKTAGARNKGGTAKRTGAAATKKRARAKPTKKGARAKR